MLVALLDLLDYQSRRVVLPERIWRNKILVTHAEVAAYLEVEIPQAVTSPSFINHDKLFPDRYCHYVTLPMNRAGERRYLKVVIEYNRGAAPEDFEGTIISVYRVGRVPAKEMRIWP